MLETIKPFNIILAADGYKGNHWEEIPETDEFNYVTVVPRSVSKYSDKIVAMGQTLISHVFASVRITMEMIDEAELEITEQGYRFNRAGWERIVREFDGKLPLRIMGVEEGRIVDPQTVIIGYTNTKAGFAWLAGYFETFIQSVVWKMSTVATICRAVRMTLIEFADFTGTERSVINYMLHNFGDRSSDGPEAAVYAGIAHAALFNGSDCIRANGYIKALYNTKKAYTTSLEATEHSTMCAHSNTEERDDFGAALMAVDRLYACVARSKEGIGVPMTSVVIDTYDADRFVEDYICVRLKDRIIASGGRLIQRPDSGDPTTSPGRVGNQLMVGFGYTETSTGHNILHPAVGVIQGDGLRVDTHRSILQGWVDAGMSLYNFCLGMGSGITHDGARDDFSFSVKATAVYRLGRWVYFLKDPKTDRKKKSLTGLVRCRETETGELEVYDSIQFGDAFKMWHDVPGWRNWYEDGFRNYRQSFDDVQNWARADTQA